MQGYKYECNDIILCARIQYCVQGYNNVDTDIISTVMVIDI